jgi:hypothetical protein
MSRGTQDTSAHPPGPPAAWRCCLFLPPALLLLALALSSPLRAGLTADGDQLWMQGSTDGSGTIAGSPEDEDQFGRVVATGDFDHDGFGDLAIGAPTEDDPEARSGVVHVIYGGPAGLSAAGDQLFGQGTAGVPGAPEGEDYFGAALAAGRFDDDLYDDLAIGVPGEEVSGADYAGAIVVLYGGASGLSATGAQLWHRDLPGIEGDAIPYDSFAKALAAGDFNDDGFDDLGVGADGGLNFSGQVLILFGGAGGFDGADAMWRQDDPIFGGTASFEDYFGSALAAGDFAGDGIDDLAIGVRGDTVGNAGEAGAVQVLEFHASGPPSAQLWHQDVAGIPGTAEEYDDFGCALAVGDFDGDGRDDLAIGSGAEDLGESGDAGAVNVLYGASGVGLTAAGSQEWDEDSPGVAGVASDGDRFGDALAAGDFDGDGRDELAIGIRFQAYGSLQYAGAVTILAGTANGLKAGGSESWSQGSAGVLGSAETEDFFAWSLAAADFDNDGSADLAIGVPGENTSAGAVNVLYGSGNFADGFESGNLSAWSSHN